MEFLRPFFLFFPLIFLLFTASCASGPRSRNQADFAAENSLQFKESALSNGIPVIIKDIPQEKNIELRLVFCGGGSVVPEQKSGIDNLSFELLSDSSAQIQEKESRGRFFPFFECRSDYSACGFVSPAAEFSGALDIFAESFLNPSFSHQDYLREEGEDAAQAFDRSENPRYGLLDVVHGIIFNGSPYKSGIFYGIKSRVSENDILAHLAGLMDSGRICILAAGNFSGEDKAAGKSAAGKNATGKNAAGKTAGKKKNGKSLFDERSDLLIQKLEGLFGGLEGSPFSAPEIPEIIIEEKNFLVRSEFAGNNYYAAFCFKAPSRGESDYVPFALCTLVLDTVLRRELVEKKQSALFAGSAVLNGKKSAALVITGGINENRDIDNEFKAALDLFPDEAALSSSLDGFKNMYASRIIASFQNASATLDQTASSIYYEGSATAWLGRLEKVRAATARDVIEAFDRYFKNAPRTHVLLTK